MDFTLDEINPIRLHDRALEEAKKIQQSMLPKTYPKIKSYDVSAGLVTSTEIGGDYYDFFEKDETLSGSKVIEVIFEFLFEFKAIKYVVFPLQVPNSKIFLLILLSEAIIQAS